MRKIWIIIQKEWAEVFKNRLVLFTVAFMPLIFTALPLIMLSATGSADGMSDLSSSDMPVSFSEMCGTMSEGACAQYWLVSQFLILYMMMPLMIPVTIASYSIVGEKSTRTLEPVLATPVKTWELLTGKALAASIPAVLVTWLGFIVFAVGAHLLAASPEVVARFLDPLWLIAIFVIGPQLSIAAVSVAVLISSRVSDPRVAEQLSAMVILPLLAVFFGQVTGFFFLNEALILWMAAVMVLIDIGLLYFATQLFQREKILTRWK